MSAWERMRQCLGQKLAPHARDEQTYFRDFRRALRWERAKSSVYRVPGLARVLRAVRRRLTSPSAR